MASGTLTTLPIGMMTAYTKYQFNKLTTLLTVSYSERFVVYVLEQTRYLEDGVL